MRKILQAWLILTSLALGWVYIIYLILGVLLS